MKSCTSCGECCTTVRARPEEAKRIRHFARENGIEWQPPERQPIDYAEMGDQGPNRYCGFLRRDGEVHRCAIYEVRPWACRAFGVVPGLECTYFPEEVVSGLSAEDAALRRLTDPADRLLGEYFESGYLERMKPFLEAADRLLTLQLLAMGQDGAKAWLKGERPRYG
jgi:Fe-S-cluster containining protein